MRCNEHSIAPFTEKFQQLGIKFCEFYEFDQNALNLVPAKFLFFVSSTFITF